MDRGRYDYSVNMLQMCLSNLRVEYERIVKVQANKIYSDETKEVFKRLEGRMMTLEESIAILKDLGQ